MRPKQLALIGLLAVILILVLYVYIAKPTLVLPGITVALPPTIPLKGYMQQEKISGLDVRVRTDGKIIANAGAKELAIINYTPLTLANSIYLAEKMLLPDPYKTTIRLVPIIFPGLTLNLLSIGMTAYYILPIEMNVRFIQG